MTKLKLGKGAAFVKSRLKRLERAEVTWEVDVRRLPLRLHDEIGQSYGLVVTAPDGLLLADLPTQRRATVNDLAALLAQAMTRPLGDEPQRPRRIRMRGERLWEELVPHLEALGIEVVTAAELPLAEAAYRDYLSHLRQQDLVKPTADQLAVEQLFPMIAKWVRGGGHIEIGDQESFGFVAQVHDCGGLVFEDDAAETLAEAMAALESGLTQWFEENG